MVMSLEDMKRAVYEIKLDVGCTEAEAEADILVMSVKDMLNYLEIEEE
jgi:hypothetical protein